MCFLTQVVVDKVCREGGLLVFPASVHTGVGVRRVHGENVGADAHQLRLPHQFPDGRGAGGQRSRQLLPGHPRLRPGVPGQLCFGAVLLQTGRDSGLRAKTEIHIYSFILINPNHRWLPTELHMSIAGDSSSSWYTLFKMFSLTPAYTAYVCCMPLNLTDDWLAVRWLMLVCWLL